MRAVKANLGVPIKGGGRVPAWFRVLGVGGSKGGPSNPLCSRHPHDEKDWKDTHVSPALPERAPSEGPRSTAALRPTWCPSRRRGASKLGRVNHFDEGRSTCALGKGGILVSLVCFWNSSMATGRTAPAPFSGSSNRVSKVRSQATSPVFSTPI